MRYAIARRLGELKKRDTIVLKGYQIYHNYFKPHEELDGQTPVEAANIDWRQK